MLKAAVPLALALSIVDPKTSYSTEEAAAGPVDGVGCVRSLSGADLSAHDLKRLSQYASNLLDYHVIVDLLPGIAASYFRGRLPVSLSYVQAAILMALGLQRRTIESIEEELKLPVSQSLALFNKAIRKIHGVMHAAREKVVIGTMAPSARTAIANPKGAAAVNASMAPHAVSLDDDLEDAGRAALRATQKALLQPEMLQQYAIDGRKGNGGGRTIDDDDIEEDDSDDDDDDAWAEADAAVAEGRVPESGLMSVKGSGLGKKRADDKSRDDKKRQEEKKRKKKQHASGEKPRKAKR